MANYKKISTVTVTGSSTASIQFASISGTYKHLLLKASARGTAATDWFRIKLNGTGSYDARYGFFTQGGTTEGDLQSSVANPLCATLTDSSQLMADLFGVAEIYIMDYTNTSYGKTIICTSGEATDSATSNSRTAMWDIASNVTGAVTQIDLEPQAGSFAVNSIFTLYGLEG